ncbi:MULTISPECIES: glycosyltransferase family 2 protein [unclassified Rhizobium]|uniref:glycosyltransferase family 2 protein n=1 Tax=unclassified Rhizobium TaxID=2613769 RepID=UPI001FCDC306|nr:MULTISPECIES: glycosyltransferase family 2 protein [unclassified Rhizobium]
MMHSRIDPARTTSPLALSVFIICKNEEAYLSNCIESLAGCAEIVIVDSGSTDGTVPLIRRYIAAGWPIRFFEEAWRGYAGQKQFALDQCTQAWCLNVDSDERLDGPLRDALPRLMAVGADVVGWKIARRPYLIGYGYTPLHVRERKNLRLVRRGAGAYDLSQAVHEGIVTHGIVRKASTGSLLHYRPLRMDEQILKENHYSTLKADQAYNTGRRPNAWSLVFSSPIYFLRLYFLTGLWRCGTSGFIEAMTGAVYAFLTQSKLHQRHALRYRANDDDSQSR